LATMGAAKSGAVGAPTAPMDPGLQRVAVAWPDLPRAVRLEFIRLAQGGVVNRTAGGPGAKTP